LLVQGPDTYFIIPANETRTIRMETGGLFTVSSHNALLSELRTEFTVLEAPVAGFDVDSETKYENGLPTTVLMSTVPGANFEWIFNNQKVVGSEVKAHFYEKGDQDVTLTVTSSNGCKNSLTKQVYIDNEYNLFAQNSFRPNSTDLNTNTFMPFGLTQRNVQFTMLIIDPNNGNVLYRTSDVSQGWDGTDMNTGQQVKLETTYVWKVTLENTEPNELRNEYSGIVTPVSSHQ
jgi:hypothetical protein